VPRNRLVLKRDRAFPYSKGLMAQSLMASGMPPDRAYRIARILEAELRRGDQRLVTSEELRQRAIDALAREEGQEAVDRYRRWHELRHLDRPLIVLIGGAPGTGKSTVATELAHRLGITRIVSSDVVRQVMRGLIAPEVLPHIHTSSFAAGRAIPAGTAEDDTVAGFLQQADTVGVGLRGVVERAVGERYPLVLEGVHVVPGSSLLPPGARATVIEALLAVDRVEAHQSHFEVRAEDTGNQRPLERYLAAFDDIRRIQDHLVRRAQRAGVPVVESGHLDGAVRRILDLTIAALEDETRLHVAAGV
jgi:2-phosphoglycerate kinase